MIDDDISLDRTELIETLIAAWRIKLGLLAWDIRYDPSLKPDKNSTANIGWREAEMVAIVRIRSDLPTRATESTVVHELLHLVLQPYADAANNCCTNTKEPLRGVMTSFLAHTQEIIIERIVRSYGLDAFTPYHKLLPKWAAFCE